MKEIKITNREIFENGIKKIICGDFYCFPFIHLIDRKAGFETKLLKQTYNPDLKTHSFFVVPFSE